MDCAAAAPGGQPRGGLGQEVISSCPSSCSPAPQVLRYAPEEGSQCRRSPPPRVKLVIERFTIASFDVTRGCAAQQLARPASPVNARAIEQFTHRFSETRDELKAAAAPHEQNGTVVLPEWSLTYARLMEVNKALKAKVIAVHRAECFWHSIKEQVNMYLLTMNCRLYIYEWLAMIPLWCSPPSTNRCYLLLIFNCYLSEHECPHDLLYLFRAIQLISSLTI